MRHCKSPRFRLPPSPETNERLVQLIQQDTEKKSGKSIRDCFYACTPVISKTILPLWAEIDSYTRQILPRFSFFGAAARGQKCVRTWDVGWKLLPCFFIFITSHLPPIRPNIRPPSIDYFFLTLWRASKKKEKPQQKKKKKKQPWTIFYR